MSTKVIIGTLVAAILYFFWQTASHTFLNLHAPNEQYTDKQEAILQCLSQNLDKEGAFFMPSLPPNASQEQMEKLMNDATGKPWAMVKYYKNWQLSMGMNMFRGFVVNIIAMFILVWLLGQIKNNSLIKSLLISIAIGIASYLTTHYTQAIWYKGNTIPDLIDAIMSWGIVGVWLGWWLNR